MSRAPRAIAAVVAVLTWFLAAPPAWADNIRDSEWYLGFLHIDQAQQISQGAGIVVAVIDTGVNANQPELAGNILPGTDSIIAQGNGWIDDSGHGTAMASLIAAHGKNTLDGALGIAPRSYLSR